MSQDKITRIASLIVGLILAVVLLYFGFKIVSGRFGQASATATDITTTNITTNSFSVTYCGGVCRSEYGLACSSDQLSLFAPCTKVGACENGTDKYECSITLLAPDTAYHLKLVCGDNARVVDNAGLCFVAKTDSESQSTTTTRSSGVQTIVTPTTAASQPTAVAPACADTDCDCIKRNIGNGQTALDFSECTEKKSAVTPVVQ